MKKTFTILTACLLFLGSIFAQDTEVEPQTGSIVGTIVDQETKEELIGATVLVIGTYRGASADINGKYEFTKMKPGDYSLKVTFIGYGEKQYNDITVKAGETTTLNMTLLPASQALEGVTIVGNKSLVNLESASSEIKISREEIKEMNVRDVQELAAMQTGVSKTSDGLQIRGARVYETRYLVDGISAQDPLAGTGFGLEVSSSSIESLDIITGGVGAEYGDGSSGIISTTIREGGETFEVAGSWQRDNLGINTNQGTAWNTDIVELSAGGPVPFTNKKMTFFTNFTTRLTDTYFGEEADQLRSSLLENNPTTWAPRQDNNWTHTIKLSYDLGKKTKLTVTNQHSLSINQNTRSLQIVGFDAILQPGYQFERSLNLDNATTYTHSSNLTALNMRHLINDRTWINVSAGRLFTNLRADANGRPFRYPTVDQIYDENSIVTDPIDIFNPGDDVVFVLPGPGLINNNGISPVWHDHYAREYTINANMTRYSKKGDNRLSFGFEHKATEYQWADITKPWIGAPIVINDSLTTPSTSIGSSNDIWAVNPFNGGFFVSNQINYKGIIATLGLRMNYWAPGKFADDAVNDPNSPVVDQVRKDYMDKTIGFGGYRIKTRLLPKVNVSFPVTENNVLYFNYGHSMKLPHPRFLYAGLDPRYQDQSFLSNLGNPDIDPEVNISYEVGYKAQITKDFGINVAAFNNNRFDYIVQRSVLVNDQTGRPVTKRMFINQDYAKIIGVEVGLNNRIGKYIRTFLNVTYQVARGKSNTARESGLQIEQNGAVPLTSEQYLAFDRPWDITTGVILKGDSSLRIFGVSTKGFRAFVSVNYQSGLRYTPYEQVGVNDLGRPLYQIQEDKFLSETGKAWINGDLKLSKDIFFKDRESGITLSFEIRNLFNNKNAQRVNPITGRGYELGDDVPNEWRDPRYIGPEESGVPPDDPARYLPPRQILYGIAFRF